MTTRNKHPSDSGPATESVLPVVEVAGQADGTDFGLPELSAASADSLSVTMSPSPRNALG